MMLLLFRIVSKIITIIVAFAIQCLPISKFLDLVALAILSKIIVLINLEIIEESLIRNISSMLIC